MPSYVVVGGSRGIGLETVRQLAANESNLVFVTVRDKANATHLNDVITNSSSDNIRVLQADVLDSASLRAAAAEIEKVTHGTLDVLFHNAIRSEAMNAFRGLTDFESDEKLDEEFLASFKVNVLGVIHSVNAFLPILRKGVAKKIVIMSTQGSKPDIVFKLRIPTMAAYGTTKAALEMVMAKYAVLLEKENFTVISICPGLVDTSATRTQKRDDSAVEEVKGQMERMQRVFTNFKYLTPEDAVARIVSVIDTVSPKDNGQFFAYYQVRQDE